MRWKFYLDALALNYFEETNGYLHFVSFLDIETITDDELHS